MCQSIRVVRSLAGRDAGHLLAVVQRDENGVWLADGKRRPLENPKCKNLRHIEWLEIELEPKAMTTNRALRRALREAEQASRTV